MDRLESLSQAAAENPNDAGVWLQLGNALFELGAIDPAQHMVARARACEPASAQHWSSLGALCLRLGDRVSALEALRAATILDSEDAEAAILFAQTAIEHGAPDEAEDLLMRTHCLDDKAVRHFLLARAKEAQGDLNAALEHVLKALSGPEEAMYEHVELAASLAKRLQRRDIEERSLLLLRRLNPRHVAHVIELSACLVRRGRTDLATQELERIGSGDDITADERAQIGAAFLELGDAARARAQLQVAVAQRPREAASRVLLAQAFEGEGNLTQAVAVYREALAVEPDRSGIHALVGKALFKAGRYAEATPNLVRAVSDTPDHAELRSILTRALLMSGDAETQPAKEGSLSGDLSVFRVEELLEFLGIQRSTGKLLLTSNGRRGVIQIVEGRLTQARYPGRASLGTVLVARGLVAAEQVRTLPREIIDDDPQLARVLVDARAIDPIQLEAVLQSRIEQGIMHILAWADGRARFEPETDAETPAFGFEHQQILMSVMARLDEQRRNRVPDRQQPQ